MQQDHFEQLIADQTAGLAVLKKTYNRCSALRAAAVAAAAVFLCLGIQAGFWLYYILCILFLIAFFGLVHWHQNIADRQGLLQAERESAQAYLDRRNGKWEKFADTGREFLTPSFPQGRDLDVFGETSLYQYICCAYTAAGRERLAVLLQEGGRVIYLFPVIVEHQAAVLVDGEYHCRIRGLDFDDAWRRVCGQRFGIALFCG